MKKLLLTTLLTVCMPVLPITAPVHNAPRQERLEIVSSWYCKGFRGRKTASGEKYNCRGFTVAHRDYPFGTRLLLRNPSNHREVVVTVNDRGPYINKRGLDTSEIVAEVLGFKDKGVTILEMIPISFGEER